jgi:hypothetical protein
MAWSFWAGETDRPIFFPETLTLVFFAFSWFLVMVSGPGDGPSPPRDKVIRNRIYLICGLGILFSTALAGVAGHFQKPIFWEETFALEFFAVAWFTKGRVIWTIRHTGKRLKKAIFKNLDKGPAQPAGI